jgi:hypothetical protein
VFDVLDDLLCNLVYVASRKDSQHMWNVARE